MRVFAAILLCGSVAWADENIVEDQTEAGDRIFILHLDGLSLGSATFNGVGISMSARPGGKGDVTFVFSRESPSGPLGRCAAVELVAERRKVRFRGKLKSFTAEKQVGDGGNTVGVFEQTLVGRFGRADLARLAAAKEVRLRACGQRYQLRPAEGASLAAFAAKVR